MSYWAFLLRYKAPVDDCLWFRSNSLVEGKLWFLPELVVGVFFALLDSAFTDPVVLLI